MAAAARQRCTVRLFRLIEGLVELGLNRPGAGLGGSQHRRVETALVACGHHGAQCRQPVHQVLAQEAPCLHRRALGLRCRTRRTVEKVAKEVQLDGDVVGGECSARGLKARRRVVCLQGLQALGGEAGRRPPGGTEGHREPGLDEFHALRARRLEEPPIAGTKVPLERHRIAPPQRGPRRSQRVIRDPAPRCQEQPSPHGQAARELARCRPAEDAAQRDEGLPPLGPGTTTTFDHARAPGQHARGRIAPLAGRWASTFSGLHDPPLPRRRMSHGRIGPRPALVGPPSGNAGGRPARGIRGSRAFDLQLAVSLLGQSRSPGVQVATLPRQLSLQRETRVTFVLRVVPAAVRRTT